MTHNISLMKHAATILVFLVMNEEGIECFLLYFSWGLLFGYDCPKLLFILYGR